MIEKMVDENFKCELYWIGVTLEKDDFLTFVQATVEDQPDVADFEIINEIQFGNVVVTKLLRQLDTREEPPNIELIIAEWEDDKVKKMRVYNTPKSDMKTSKEWVESFQKDSE